MKKFALASLACAAAVAGCSAPRVPDDAQLTALLRAERAQAGDANARIEGSAVACLRAWSGDDKLSQNLPAAMRTDASKKACREKLQPWFGDATRNPEKFTFEDVSQPAVVTRVMNLYMARAAGGMGAAPPAVVTTVPAAPKPAQGSVDLGTAGAALQQTENVCQRVQQVATTQPANQRAKRFAEFCARRVQQLRTNMEQATGRNDSEQLDKLAADARRLAEIGERAAADHP
jgi:hypothetical protein